MKTYDEILTGMKNAFYEISGENVEKYSERDTRFKAVASELFSLSLGSEYNLKQMFPQTAQGEYLDFHAQLRGITRKTKSKARLTLTFYLAEPAENDILIESGCICACENEPYIQFETTEDTVISAGETSAVADAAATEGGSSHNVKEGEVTVIVNPPLGVSGVTNGAPYEYGFDEEYDEALRKRILSAYSIPSTGFSTRSLAEAVCSLDEILDCSVNYDGYSLGVTVKTKDSEISETLAQKIYNLLLAADLFESDINVRIASRRTFGIKLDVNGRGDRERIEKDIKERVGELTAALSIGESLELSKVAYSLSSIDGVRYCDASSPDSQGRIILCEAYEYLYPGSIEVNFYE